MFITTCAEIALGMVYRERGADTGTRHSGFHWTALA